MVNLFVSPCSLDTFLVTIAPPLQAQDPLQMPDPEVLDLKMQDTQAPDFQVAVSQVADSSPSLPEPEYDTSPSLPQPEYDMAARHEFARFSLGYIAQPLAEWLRLEDEEVSWAGIGCWFRVQRH
jgi:hypothetical protein